jgi:hypothetical protein
MNADVPVLLLLEFTAAAAQGHGAHSIEELF